MHQREAVGVRRRDGTREIEGEFHGEWCERPRTRRKGRRYFYGNEKRTVENRVAAARKVAFRCIVACGTMGEMNIV